MSEKVLTAQELRIGNILQYYIGEEGCDWSETTIDWQDLKWISELPDNFNKVHNPIPLTQEWLVRFGFFWSGSDHFASSDNSMWIEDIRGRFRVCKPFVSRTFNTVHDLQNIIFALTGNELKVK